MFLKSEDLICMLSVEDLEFKFKIQQCSEKDSGQ